MKKCLKYFIVRLKIFLGLYTTFCIKCQHVLEGTGEFGPLYCIQDYSVEKQKIIKVPCMWINKHGRCLKFIPVLKEDSQVPRVWVSWIPSTRGKKR